MATARASASGRRENCDRNLLSDFSRDPGLNLRNPLSLREFTLGTFINKLRIAERDFTLRKLLLAQTYRHAQRTET